MAFAFGNIAWYRNRRSPQLLAEAVNLMMRKLRGVSVDINSEFHSLVPHA
jgi:hypothetical protein